jgi:translation initiation factor IF-2
MGSIRLSKVLNELNISLDRAVEFLAGKGHEIENNRNTKITDDQYDLLVKAFEQDKTSKEKSEQISQQVREEKETLRAEKESVRKPEAAPVKEAVAAPVKPEVVAAPEKPAPLPKPAEVKEKAITPAETHVEAPAEPVVQKTVEPAPSVEPAENPVFEAKEVEEPANPDAEEDKASEKGSVMKAKATRLSGPTVVAKIDLDATRKKKPAAKEPAPETPASEPKPVAVKEVAVVEPVILPEAEVAVPDSAPKEAEAGSDHIQTKYIKLDGLKFTGQKIELPVDKPKKKVEDDNSQRNKRKRIKKVPEKTTDPNAKPGATQGGAARPGQRPQDKRKPVAAKPELTEEDIQKQIKETLEKLTSGKKSKGAKLRREKRDARRERVELEDIQREEDSKVLKVTEFVTVTELANMMNVPVTKVIGTLMGLGVMVTMNQRLDAEVLSLVAEEFGFTAEFVDQEVTDTFAVEEEREEDLVPRAPIVTVMGHVDHGKTSLLDYIRKANVIAGEAGGITQHIGAYAVKLDTGQQITFLDTPGHEAFTAMRARGAQVTDVAIIVVAADDAVMPQTKEAIAHAQAANVPIVFAINKIDKANANPEKIKEQLAGLNLLVEDWGGKIQSQEISAKAGTGVRELLEKVLLEAEMLDLKANPDRNAAGTVIEATLDKGRGFVTTILVESGTLKMGDFVLAGQYSGKVKAMLDERGHRMKEAGPSTPVSLLGLDGAPQAGDRFVVMEDEREAKQIAAKRMQLQREQSVRSQKKMTLEEIGRRLAIGDFQELNIVLKGDVDGSVEALADSLQKLSTEEIAVRIIHKGVGQISEGDVLLASASDAIIVGFQVRPSANARKLAEKEDIDIRLYSIIYDAINEIRDAMEGMLSPELKEEITGTAEIRETFKISKVGTIAGCMVIEGTIVRNNRVRIIRDGVVIYTGELGSLKRFKDDVKEVNRGYECGLNIANFNDIKTGDLVEAFKEIQVKKTLD